MLAVLSEFWAKLIFSWSSPACFFQGVHPKFFKAFLFPLLFFNQATDIAEQDAPTAGVGQGMCLQLTTVHQVVDRLIITEAEDSRRFRNRYKPVDGGEIGQGCGVG